MELEGELSAVTTPDYPISTSSTPVRRQQHPQPNSGKSRVRDFAYPDSDRRHWGYYPALPAARSGPAAAAGKSSSNLTATQPQPPSAKPTTTSNNASSSSSSSSSKNALLNRSSHISNSSTEDDDDEDNDDSVLHFHHTSSSSSSPATSPNSIPRQQQSDSGDGSGAILYKNNTATISQRQQSTTPHHHHHRQISSSNSATNVGGGGGGGGGAAATKSHSSLNSHGGSTSLLLDAHSFSGHHQIFDESIDAVSNPLLEIYPVSTSNIPHPSNMDASQKAIYPPESITLLKSFFDSPRFLKSLQRILHLTPAVDDGLLFGFYKSRALFEFTKFTEWEMDIDVGQEMLVAYRDIDAEKKKEEASSNGGGIKNESSSSSLAADTVAAVAATKIITATTDSTKSSTLFTTATSSASPSLSSTSSPSTSSNNNNNNNSQVPRLAPASNNLERWVSIDEDLLGDEEDDEGSKSNPAASDGSGGEQDSNFTTDDIDMKLFLDPDPNIFASQLREFVEYQKVYGEGWITVVAMRVFARRNKNGDDSHWKIGVQMCDLGLVPVQYIQKEK